MNYEIKNDKITMVISSLGAEPQSLIFEGREYLWQGDKTYWFRRAPLLFPMIGPTKDNKISVDGVLYDMPNNGFARDTEFSFVEKTDSSITFVLEDSEKSRKENYPFGFVLKVTYTLLCDGYEAKAEIKAKDDLWYTFGWHPAFSLDINGKGTELDTYSVHFSEKENCTKKTAINGVFQYFHSFLNGNEIKLSRELTDFGAIILDGVKSREVTLTSSSGPHGVKATLGTMDTFTVWTCAPQHGQYVCLEPMVSFGDSARDLELKNMKETRELKKGESVVYTNSFHVF